MCKREAAGPRPLVDKVREQGEVRERETARGKRYGRGGGGGVATSNRVLTFYSLFTVMSALSSIFHSRSPLLLTSFPIQTRAGITRCSTF